MRIYRIGICDDERSTCAELENIIYDYFKKLHNAVDITVWYTGEDCYKSIERETYDVLFLDIELPEMNGVSVGQRIREQLNNQSLQIIYISSKTNYALELFQVHPYDFLIKPLDASSIERTFDKVLSIDESDGRFFTYQTNRIEKKVLMGRIEYLASQHKHVEIHLSDGSVDKYMGKLKDAESKMPSQFVRIAQSYIVNLKYVMICRYDYVQMASGEVLNITVPYRENVRKSVINYNEGGAGNE